MKKIQKIMILIPVIALIFSLNINFVSAETVDRLEDAFMEYGFTKNSNVDISEETQKLRDYFGDSDNVANTNASFDQILQVIYILKVFGLIN